MNGNDETFKTYEEQAEQIAAAHNGQAHMSHFHDLFQAFLPEGKVYDMGCGAGRDVAALQAKGYDVIGFDASPAMLRIARMNHPSCTFCEMDLLDSEAYADLPQADGLWMCASLLHFTPSDMQEAFRQCAEKVRKDGLLYISLKLRDSLQEEVINGRYFSFYTDEWLRNWFTGQGYTILHQEQNENGRDTFGSYFLRKTC